MTAHIIGRTEPRHTVCRPVTPVESCPHGPCDARHGACRPVTQLVSCPPHSLCRAHHTHLMSLRLPPHTSCRPVTPSTSFVNLADMTNVMCRKTIPDGVTKRHLNACPGQRPQKKKTPFTWCKKSAFGTQGKRHPGPRRSSFLVT